MLGAVALRCVPRSVAADEDPSPVFEGATLTARFRRRGGYRTRSVAYMLFSRLAKFSLGADGIVVVAVAGTVVGCWAAVDVEGNGEAKRVCVFDVVDIDDLFAVDAAAVDFALDFFAGLR